MSWDAYITDHLMVRSNTDTQYICILLSNRAVAVGCFRFWVGASFKSLVLCIWPWQSWRERRTFWHDPATQKSACILHCTSNGLYERVP